MQNEKVFAKLQLENEHPLLKFHVAPRARSDFVSVNFIFGLGLAARLNFLEEEGVHLGD